MVCVFGFALACAGVVKLRVRWTAGRYAVAAVLTLSGAWLMIAPRADQPLLDIAEYVFPGIRVIYMGDAALAAYNDAAQQAQRYRGEVDKLNEREARSRWQGQALDDIEVRRISSFLTSYGEMLKGEQFVMREVRVRARERARWVLGGALVVAGVAPGAWLQRRRFNHSS